MMNNNWYKNEEEEMLAEKLISMEKAALKKWFTGPEMDKYREYEKFEKCSRCELQRFCRGCPAVAAGYSGSMYAADPQCWKEVS